MFNDLKSSNETDRESRKEGGRCKGDGEEGDRGKGEQEEGGSKLKFSDSKLCDLFAKPWGLL